MKQHLVQFKQLKKKRLWYSILSIALAIAIVAGNCYFAPARALANDGETAFTTEAEGPETVVEEQAPEPEPEVIVEESEAPAEATEPAAQPETAGSELSETGSTPEQGADLNTITDPGADPDKSDDELNNEETDPAEKTDEDLNKENESEKTDSSDETDESTIELEIALVFRSGQEILAEDSLKLHEGSNDLNSQWKSFEGYEQGSLSIDYEGGSSDTSTIELKNEDGEAAAYINVDDSDLRISGITVTYQYNKLPDTEDNDKEDTDDKKDDASESMTAEPEVIEKEETVVNEIVKDSKAKFSFLCVDGEGDEIEDATADDFEFEGDNASLDLIADNVQKIEGYLYYEATAGEGVVTGIRKATKVEIEETDRKEEIIAAEESSESEEADEATEEAAAEDDDEEAAEADDETAEPEQQIKKITIYEDHTKTVQYFMTVNGEEIEVTEDTEITLHYDLDIPEIELRYHVVDENDYSIDGYGYSLLPEFEETLDLTKSPLEEAVTSIERIGDTNRGYEISYNYIEAKIGGKKVDSLTKTVNERTGRAIYSYEVDGEEFILEKDTIVILKFAAKENHKKVYIYNEDDMLVIVRLETPDAVPDTADLVVTPITDGTAYDAYMGALNQDDESKNYDGSNTLLYDIAFMVDSAEGDGKVEYEPKAGTVSVSVRFRQNQLSDLSSGSGDVEVKHLPLNDDVKASVDATIEATDISADDIQVQSVQELDASAEGNSVEFKTDGFSVFAVTTSTTLDKGHSDLIKVVFKDEEGLAITGAMSPTSEENYYIVARIKHKSDKKYYYKLWNITSSVLTEGIEIKDNGQYWRDFITTDGIALSNSITDDNIDIYIATNKNGVANELSVSNIESDAASVEIGDSLGTYSIRSVEYTYGTNTESNGKEYRTNEVITYTLGHESYHIGIEFIDKDGNPVRSGSIDNEYYRIKVACPDNIYNTYEIVLDSNASQTIVIDSVPSMYSDSIYTYQKGDTIGVTLLHYPGTVSGNSGWTVDVSEGGEANGYTVHYIKHANGNKTTIQFQDPAAYSYEFIVEDEDGNPTVASDLGDYYIYAATNRNGTTYINAEKANLSGGKFSTFFNSSNIYDGNSKIFYDGAQDVSLSIAKPQNGSTDLGSIHTNATKLTTGDEVGKYILEDITQGTDKTVFTLKEKVAPRVTVIINDDTSEQPSFERAGKYYLLTTLVNGYSKDHWNYTEIDGSSKEKQYKIDGFYNKDGSDPMYLSDDRSYEATIVYVPDGMTMSYNVAAELTGSGNYNGAKLYKTGDPVEMYRITTGAADAESMNVTVTLDRLEGLTTTINAQNESGTLDSSDISKNYYILVQMDKEDDSGHVAKYYALCSYDISSDKAQSRQETIDAFKSKDQSESAYYSGSEDLSYYVVTSDNDALTLSDAISGTGCTKFSEDQITEGYLVSINKEENNIAVVLSKVEGEGKNHTATIKFYDFGSTENVLPVDPALSGNYYILSTLKAKKSEGGTGDSIVAWSVTKVNDFDANEDGIVEVNINKTFTVADSDGTATDTTIDYIPEHYKLSTRLYRADDADTSPTYNSLKSSGEDTVPGYIFLSNVQSDDGLTSVISLQKSYIREFYVQLRFSPEGTLIAEDDNWYLFVELKHESSGTDYYIEPIVSNGSSTVEFEVGDEDHPWKSNDDKTNKNTFSGNEEVILHIIKSSGKAVTVNNAVNKADHCTFIKEGGNVKDYAVSYDTSKSVVENADSRTTSYTYYIDLTKIEATNDYNYQSILGPSLTYGIVAEHLYHQNHLQTNFAVNHYTGAGIDTRPDLSGTSSGAIVIAQYNENNHEAKNHVGAVANSGDAGKLFVGNPLRGTLVAYVDRNSGDTTERVRGNLAQTAVIETEGATLSTDIVEPAIQYGKNISTELLGHSVTFDPAIPSGGKLTIDTTDFPDDATIYIDADRIKDYLTEGKLIINKKADQTIIFNFDSTDRVTIGQFTVNGFLTETPEAKDSPKNATMDQIARHIVWNCNSCSYVKIDNSCGIFLEPNDGSEVEVGTTSGGWIVSDGYVHNSSGEWHNFYADMPAVDKVNLKAVKTLDGKTPKANQKFDFTLERYVEDTETKKYIWVELQTKQNASSSITFDPIDEVAEGWNIFRIKESQTVPADTPGAYTTSTDVYYAAVECKIFNKGLVNQTTIIGYPSYYKEFDENAYQPVIEGEVNTTLTGVSGTKYNSATFDNTTITNALQISKKVNGTPSDNDTLFTFEISLTDSAEQPVSDTFTQSYNGTDSDIVFDSDGKATVTLKADESLLIKGLAAGTKYSVREIKVGDKDIPSDNSAVDGYTLNTSSTSGTTGTISTTKGGVAKFVNDYEDEQEGSLTVTKTFTGDHAKLTADQKNAISFTVTGPGDYEESFTYADMTGGSKTLEHLALGKYTVTESNTSVTGFSVVTTYEVGETKTNEVTLADGDDKTVAVTNAYTELKGGLTITKSFTGDTSELTDDYKNAITFTITGPDSYSKTVSYSQFTDSSYTESDLTPGTYTVAENNANLDGYIVTTTYAVGDDETGTVALTSDGAAVNVTNDYNKQEGSLTVTKTFTGDHAKLTADQKNAISFTVTGPGDYEESFTYADMTGGSKTLEHLALGKYTVTESNTSVTGFSVVTTYEVGETKTNEVTLADGDDKTVAVTNDYSYHAAGSTSLDGTKVLEGRDFKSGDSWIFTVTANDESAPMPTKNPVTINPTGGKEQHLDFGTISYTEADIDKTYIYTVTESGTVAGVENDAVAKTVTVTITDNGDGTLKVEKSFGSDGMIRFVNHYNAGGETTLTGVKALEGRDFRSGDKWTFTVTSDASAPMPERTSVTIEPASGNTAAIDFGKIKFSLSDVGKTYTYTVTESGSVENVVNDGAKTVTIKVTDAGDGTLAISKSYSSGSQLRFTNRYEKKTIETSVRKVWVDENNKAKARPAAIQVQLYQDGAALGAAVTLNEGNGWAYKWTGLDAEKSYAVSELNVPAGYVATTSGSAAGGFVITNTYEVKEDKTSVSAKPGSTRTTAMARGRRR